MRHAAVKDHRGTWHMCVDLTKTYCGIYKATPEWRLLRTENDVGYGTSCPVREIFKFSRHHDLRGVLIAVGRNLECPTFMSLCRPHSTMSVMRT